MNETTNTQIVDYGFTELATPDDNRKAAYQTEADPLFFKWQAGEGTQEEWQAKREEIRQRYPK